MPPNPEATPSPSEQRRKLYQAIGEATTAWAAVEDRLSVLFAYFVTGNAQSEAASAAFHAVINFNSKLAMAHRAAEYRIYGDHLARWQTLHNRLNRQAKNRNDIVHFSLLRGGDFPFGQLEYFLSPSLYNASLYRSSAERPSLKAADITHRVTRFSSTAKDLAEFAVQIGATSGTPQGPSEESLERLFVHHRDSTDSEEPPTQ
jgi:hypothetical protein